MLSRHFDLYLAIPLPIGLEVGGSWEVGGGGKGITADVANLRGNFKANKLPASSRIIMAENVSNM